MGPGAHVLAVCQPCVAALAAAALMAEDQSRCTPRSLTLMAGPIDCRINPTRVNELATAHPIDWFEHNLISRVPLRFRGALRRVYPGFLQLSAFMSMNLERHVQAFVNLHKYLVDGEVEKAEATRASTRSTSRSPTCPRSSTWRPWSTSSRTTRSPRASCTTRPAGASRRRSAAPRCSRSRASATTSARSARRWRRRTCAPASCRSCAAPHAGGRRALRGVQRQALEPGGVSGGAGDDPRGGVTGLAPRQHPPRLAQLRNLALAFEARHDRREQRTRGRGRLRRIESRQVQCRAQREESRVLAARAVQ